MTEDEYMGFEGDHSEGDVEESKAGRQVGYLAFGKGE